MFFVSESLVIRVCRRIGGSGARRFAAHPRYFVIRRIDGSEDHGVNIAAQNVIHRLVAARG